VTRPLAEARFPGVATDAGHYESWFVKGHHPTAPQAFWLRHTVHQRPGRPPTASLWLTLFDGDAPDGRTVVAGKQTVARPTVPGDGYVAIAGATLGPGRLRGTLESPTLDAAWDVTFAGAQPEQRHLPAGWMYDAPVPRTKSGTPHPGVTFGGRLGPFDVDGWTGLVSHNWGAEHAERWIWLHGATFAGRDAGDWLELVLGRIRLGPWTTPWIGNGALHLDGERLRLGGIDRVRSTRVDESPTGARFLLTGEGVRVEGEIRAPADRFVCWRYADPDGPEHHSAHCSIADLRVEVRRDGRPTEILEAPAAGSYELGMRETDHGLEVQPYADGTL
jgi:hypothetical protein